MVLNALGWVGSALLIYSLMQARVLRFRLLNLVACLILVIFNALLGIWPMVVMNVALAGINLWFIRKLASERHSDKAFEVLEVGPLDEYLRHTLRVHAADIEKYQPGFAWDGTAPGHTAYLVERGDETVGVVLVHDAGDGVAQVRLDYVTPRFRDFTPGEFVYRQSGLFSSRGFRRVVTPAGMVAPYYGRLGMRREGESYVLDVG
ncbi:MAG TPA: hypothetical protein VF391_05370 [Dermatophilaceae bacterium]|jgi:hypothetical protein